MSVALELIRKVQANGGQICIDGKDIVIAPKAVALPLVDSLRRHKPEIIRLLESAVSPVDDLGPWRELCGRWLTENCISRPGYDDWGGIGCLWVDFCEWAVNHDSVPCQRQAFEQLLRDSGFGLEDGFVRGLVIKVDLEIVKNWRLVQWH